MSDTKAYFLFLAIIFAGYIFIENFTTILPICCDDEFFIDEYGGIHGDNCPYQEVPWFTRKYSKYNILIKKDQEICKECLLFEEDKLWELHCINLYLREKILRANGAPIEYIERKMQGYKR